MSKRTSNWIRPDKRLALYMRDGFECCYCGVDMAEWGRFDVTLDHIRPHCKGGNNTAHNLVTCCRSCNSSRQETPVATFARRKGLNPSTIWGRISARRARDLAPFRRTAKELIANV